MINLDGNQGILLAKHIFNLDIQLWAVKGRFSDTNRVLNAQMIQDSLHGALSLIPLLGGTDIFVLILRIPLGEAIGNILGQA